MARDGLLLDGPCDLLFETLCVGATQVAPNELARIILDILSSEPNGTVKLEQRRDWLWQALETMKLLEAEHDTCIRTAAF